MLPDFAEVARRFILYRPRFEARTVWVSRKDLSHSHPVIGPFIVSLEQGFPSARSDDLAIIAFEFLARYRELAAWYDAVLSCRNIEVSFSGGEPMIRPTRGNHDAIDPQEWMDLCGWIDPDALIARQFAGVFNRPARVLDIANWGVYARFHDTSIIGQPMWQRLRDIHTHLSGCEIAPLLWQELLAGQITIDRLPAYSNPDMARASGSRGTAAERACEQHDIEAAIRHWRPALEGQDWTSWLYPAGMPNRFGSHDMATELRPERCCLIRRWLAILNQPDTDHPELHMARVSLDRYLYAKNLFTRRHIQSPANNPGLESFRRNFDLLRPIRTAKSADVTRRYLKRWRDFAFDAPSLDHVELRIAPCDSVSSYTQFLTDLREVFREVSAIAPRPAIPGRSMPRFVVHFIRPRQSEETVGQGPDLHRMRLALDKDFHALHAFLFDHDAPEATQAVRQMIVGIDVCNTERNAPIEFYSSYIRALRNQRLDPVDEEIMKLPSIYLERFGRIRRQPMLFGQTATLGLTVHAGEDYYHPLIGLREIWGAMIDCQMRPGDRLGHALALGADIPAFTRAYGSGCVVPRGAILDAVVWMQRRLGTIPNTDLRTDRALEDVIARASRKIYGRSYRAETLKRLTDLRSHPVDRATASSAAFRTAVSLNSNDEAYELLLRELTDASVSNQRAKLITLPGELARPWIVADMQRLQEMLVGLACDRRIVIEMNPSSNRAVGDFRSMHEHPILGVKVRHPSLRVAVSCDDPGNFGTRIENEYALVAHGLRELVGDREAERAILDDMIETTRAAAFGRAAFSNDPSDWQSLRPGDPEVRHNPDAGPD